MIHWILALVLQHWLVINDVHLNPFSDDGIVYGADTTPALWDSALRAMRADAPDARVVFLGGDMLAHHFSAESIAAHRLPTQSALGVARTIASTLQTDFPRAQFLVALGNNDDPCGDYRSESGGTYQTALAKIWAPLVNRDGVAPDFIAQFSKGGYYTARLPIRAGRAIVLNSVFWSLIYSGGCSSRPRDPGGAELSWLQTQLHQLPSNANVVMLMHIPPGYDPRGTEIVHRVVAVPFLRPAYNQALLQMLAAQAASVRFAVGAHTHRYDFRVAGGIPMLIAASISPIYRNNPVFFVLAVDENGELHDVQPYIYDLDTMRWAKAPSFDAMYGVKALTPDNLTAIAAKIRADAAVRARWSAAYNTWGIDDRLPVIWLPYACAQTELENGYAACAGTANRTRVVVLLAAGVLLCFIIIASLLLRRSTTRSP